MHRISLKSLTVGVLLAMVLLSALHTIFAKRLFRDDALDAEKRSLSHVIDVAGREVLRQARGRALTLGHSLEARIRPFGQKLAEVPAERWGELLDEPFIKGFPNFHLIELTKLRVYDARLNWVAESDRGVEGLKRQLPGFIERQARERHGVDRLKALGGLWTPAEGAPLYSVLVPIGGLRVNGYLEVVIAPLLNLRAVGEMILLPYAIDDGRGVTVHHPTISPTDESHSRVSHPLIGDDGRLAYYLITYLDQSAFYARMHESQFRASILFFGISLLVLLAALWIFNRYLFHPVHRMIDDIEHAMHGDEVKIIPGHGIKEVRYLADAFNLMTDKVRISINELQQLSHQDGLTGVANRRRFDATLEQEWKRASRDRTPVSLLLIDVDFFKRYNDSLGHQAGDDCLRMIASTLQGALQRPNDLVARYGGEEFAVILPGTGEAGAEEVALRLKRSCDEHRMIHPASDISNHVTLSIGAATLVPGKGEGEETLITAADAALYRAKHNGRDRFEAAAAA